MSHTHTHTPSVSVVSVLELRVQLFLLKKYSFGKQVFLIYLQNTNIIYGLLDILLL